MEAPNDKNPAPHRMLRPDNVDELASYLESMPARQQFSIREAVRMLMPQIMELRKKGYSLAQIADMIRDQGFDLSPNTFRAYVGMEGGNGGRVADVLTEQGTPVKAGTPRSRPGKGKEKSGLERPRRKLSGTSATVDNSSSHEEPGTPGTVMAPGKFKPKQDRDQI